MEMEQGRSVTGAGRILRTFPADAMSAASMMMGGRGAMVAATVDVAGGKIASAIGDMTTRKIAGARRACLRKTTMLTGRANGPVLTRSWQPCREAAHPF
jgi:hypothetical protein